MYILVGVELEVAVLSKLSSIVNNPSTKVKIVGSSVITEDNSAASGSGSG